MHSENIRKEYIELLKENSKEYYKEFKEMEKQSVKDGVLDKGQPVPFTYQPFFLDLKDLRDFKRISKEIMEICKAVIAEYRNNSEYRKLFDFPDFIEKMILKDCPYDMPIPMARFDVFYNTYEDFQFCEINTDGSSAMQEDRGLSRILAKSDAFKKFSKDYQLSFFELFDSWVEKSLEIYKKARPDSGLPNVCIMDFKESATGPDFKLFKEAYERAGVNCEIGDPKDMEYKDGALFIGDFKIDMIYRRLVTFELIREPERAKAFIDAYMDDAVVTIGTIQSQVAHTKLFFKILFDDMTKKILTDEQNEFVKKHIPYTGDLTKEILPKLFENKDGYIVKPYDMNACQGVYTGRDLSQEEWEKNLERDKDKGFIYQEFVEGKTIPFVEFNEDGEIELIDRANMAGIFTYGEEFAGLYTRMGVNSIIGSIHGYVTAPAFLAVRRSMDDILPRINELAKKAKETALTDSELSEQKALREEYLMRFREGMRNTLMNVKVVDDEGNDITEEKLNKLYKEQQRHE